MSINRTLTEEMIARNITTRDDIIFYINKTNVYPFESIAAINKCSAINKCAAIDKIAGSYEARDASNCLFSKTTIAHFSRWVSGHPLLRCYSKFWSCEIDNNGRSLFRYCSRMESFSLSRRNSGPGHKRTFNGGPVSCLACERIVLINGNRHYIKKVSVEHSHQITGEYLIFAYLIGAFKE